MLDENLELYKNVIAVSNRMLCSRPFLEQVRRVCELHPKAFILREKDLPVSEYRELARQVGEICRSNGVPLVIHSHYHCALELGCDVLHLPLHLFRANGDKISGITKIGCSVHSLKELQEAERLGATYLIAGHIYATQCKAGAPPRGLAFLRQICGQTDLPVYAIGGIKLNQTQLAEVMSCGAKGGCIMSEMMTI